MLEIVRLEKKSGHEYYIYFEGNNFEEYLGFTAMLGNVDSRYFDSEKQCYCCNSVDAQKIQDELNYPNFGDDLKLKPYGYQRQAAVFCLKQNDQGALIGLCCGAGKSAVFLAIINELKKHDESLSAVVVVKASLKEQWLEEVSKFTDYKATIIDTYKASTKSIAGKIRRKEKEAQKLMDDVKHDHIKELAALNTEITALKKEQEGSFHKLFDPEKYDIFIVGYETLTDDTVKSEFQKLAPKIWCVDEIDCIKNPHAKRSLALYTFNKAPFRYGATATPIRKNPKDLYGIFTFLNPSLFPNERMFDETYLTFWRGRVSGSKNEEQLANIVAPYMFRRTFDEIADQLPTLTVIPVKCYFTDKQKKKDKLLSDEAQDMKDEAETIYAQSGPVAAEKNPRYKMLQDGIIARQTFRQMLADDERLLANSDSNLAHKYTTGDKSPKLEMCIELIEKIISSGKKVVIFSKYLGMLDFIEEAVLADPELEGNIVSKITGSTSGEDRSDIIKKVNNDTVHNILLLSDAGEAGLNLQAIPYMIEYELAESAAKQTQRHGRIVRASSKYSKSIVFQLIVEDSWDTICQQIIAKKQGYNEKIIEGGGST